MTVLAILVFSLLMSLGFWQIQRGQEKKSMLVAQQLEANKSAQLWSPVNNNPQQYQPLELIGHYLPFILFLDNQHFQHQFGYHVLSPLVLSNHRIVLVDRGWVAGEASRAILPLTKTPTGQQKIEGSVYYPSVNHWTLGTIIEQKNDQAALIEQIDIKLISEFLHKSLYPFIIRLDKSAAEGYVREWAIVAMPPERHYAYALQWFALALVILGLYTVLNLKKIDE